MKKTYGRILFISSFLVFICYVMDRSVYAYNNSTCLIATDGCKQGETGNGFCSSQTSPDNCSGGGAACSAASNAGNYQCLPSASTGTMTILQCQPNGLTVPCGQHESYTCYWVGDPTDACKTDETASPTNGAMGCTTVQCTPPSN